jgi:hypothetical protein
MVKGTHPDFWGREGRGGEEWDVVDRPSERGEELGGQGFDKPRRRPDDEPHGQGEIAPGDDDGLPDGPARHRVPS